MFRHPVLLAAVVASFFVEQDPTRVGAFGFLAILPALLSGLAAAGTGIAGGVAAGQAADDARKNSAAGRAQQMALAKMQIKAQQEEQAKAHEQAQTQALSSLYGGQADRAFGLAQRQTDANTDAMGTIAKAMLRGRS